MVAEGGSPAWPPGACISKLALPLCPGAVFNDIEMTKVLEVHPTRVELLVVDGRELPYVEFHHPEPAIKLIYNGEEYAFLRTMPLRGYAPLLLRLLREAEAEGRKVLVAYFPPRRNFPSSYHWERLYIYSTGVRPIGMGKAPAA